MDRLRVLRARVVHGPAGLGVVRRRLSPRRASIVLYAMTCMKRLTAVLGVPGVVVVLRLGLPVLGALGFASNGLLTAERNGPRRWVGSQSLRGRRTAEFARPNDIGLATGGAHDSLARDVQRLERRPMAEVLAISRPGVQARPAFDFKGARPDDDDTRGA